jgi:hypothetical protein
MLKQGITKLMPSDLIRQISLMEDLSTPRMIRSLFPVLKYDYRGGDYFSKLYKEIYPHLLPSIVSISGSLVTAP